MENTSVSKIVLNQDTAKVIRETISIEIPTATQVKVEAPSTISEIPEVPKRFQKVQKPRKTISKAVFVPSVQDSIEFNLKTRRTEGEGILNNTVVRDFLSPIPRSDKQWIFADEHLLTEGYQVRTKVTQKVDTLYESSSEVSVQDTLVRNYQEDSLAVRGDSLLSNRPSSKGLHAETLAKEEEERPFHENGYAKDVLTGLLILSVALTGIIRLTNFRYMRELFSSVLFSQFARKMLKSENLRNQKAAFALSGLFLFNTSIFIYEYVSYHQISTVLNKGLLLIPLVMTVVFAFGFVKGMLYRFVAYVFDCKQQTAEYIFYMRLHDKVFGLVMIPVILMVPYIDVNGASLLFHLGIGIYVLLYLIQLFRGLTIILKNVASLFYMFLYLCALEILPLIIMYNILII